MSDEQQLWINVNHPCYKVDVAEARPDNDEDARGLWGQGYVPLERLREMADRLWHDMEAGMRDFDNGRDVGKRTANYGELPY